MLMTLLKGKLHRARVTSCDLHYEGSISIDLNLLEASGIVPFEKVAVWNVTTGARIETYAIEAPRGSGMIGLNGSAARHFEIDDITIIAAFVQMTPDEAEGFSPKVVLLDEGNTVKG